MTYSNLKLRCFSTLKHENLFRKHPETETRLIVSLLVETNVEHPQFVATERFINKCKFRHLKLDSNVNLGQETRNYLTLDLLNKMSMLKKLVLSTCSFLSLLVK